ncbi:hypothetical protein LCGC14_1946390 [marine sediment metagenome]|uniref:Uncharacterized protein n=1 Tax=marine sediment metagenome TaxID=412755 RepID=A0A0F9HX45_9ZZZZ
MLMQPLWKVEALTPQFKYQDDIWSIMHDGDTDDTVVVRNERTKHITPLSIYCPVEPVLVGLFKVMFRKDPVKMARCKEAIQDLLDIGTLPDKRGLENVSIGEIALAFDELDDSEN